MIMKMSPVAEEPFLEAAELNFNVLSMADLLMGDPVPRIRRYVFFHSIALALLVGGLITLQFYVWPFTSMVVRQAGRHSSAGTFSAGEKRVDKCLDAR
jgi:hypothetical protein